MDTKTAWRFRGSDGLYVGPIDVYPNALEPDKWHIPENATFTQPTQSIIDGEMLGYWIGSSWSSVSIPVTENVTPIEAKRAAILEAIDNTTSGLIVNCFYPKGQRSRLSVSDQINFEGELTEFYRMKQDGEYVESEHFPLEIKTGTDSNGSPIMTAIGTFEEYRDFVRSGKAWIRKNLDEGWALKKQVSVMTEAQLDSFVDDRGQV